MNDVPAIDQGIVPVENNGNRSFQGNIVQRTIFPEGDGIESR